MPGAPLLANRKNPLRIEVYQGSIDAQVDQLRNIDAVVALQVLEHLEPNVLDNVPNNVFGFMQPKIAIFATPNRDFNVLFDLAANGLRHSTHKFEWTSCDFYLWAQTICAHYPNYKLWILGVGNPPADRKNMGHCSQIALFMRSDVLDLPLAMPLQKNIASDLNPNIQFKEKTVINFPLNRDERTTEKKLLDKAEYIVYSMRNPQFLNRKRHVYEIPIKPLITFADSIDVSEQELRSILRQKANWLMAERLFLVLPEFKGIKPVCESDANSDVRAETVNLKKIGTIL